MLLLSYNTLLFNLAGDAGKFGSNVTAPDKEQLTYYLNEAVRWAWKDFYVAFAHPDTIADGELAVTSGRVASALFADSIDYITVWTADPRSTKAARRVPHLRDASGLVLTGNEPPATVYAFWRAARPRFTVTAVVPGTTYPAGSLVFNATDGHCYLAKVSALGSALADATKWTKQELPESLELAVRFYARWKWLAAKDLNSNASAAYAAARETINDAIERVSPLPFWLQDGSNSNLT